MATFITSKSVGENLGIQVYSSTFFWKYNHDGVDSPVKTAGYSSIPVTNANGEFTIISCDSNGNQSGYLQTLVLDNNQLTSFDGTGLSNLTNLVLHGNQLTSCSNLPSSLTNLELYTNQLTSFDGTGLSNLVYLYLQGNPLTSFDGTDLTSLQILNVGGSKDTSIPLTSVSNLPSSLVQLGLFNSQLTSFDGTGLTSLNNLNLGYNQITLFDGTDLTSLTYLNLIGNQLTSFDGTGLSNLQYLYLQNNQISSFTWPAPNGGESNGGLTNLSLVGNQLTSLDITNMPSLTFLALSDPYGLNGNPMTTSANDSLLTTFYNRYAMSNFRPYVTIHSQNGRTAATTSMYDSMIGWGWNLVGLDLVTPPVTGNGKLRIKGVNSGGGTTTTTTTTAPNYTIKTIKPVGESFGINNIVTSTGYWLYSHDGTNSAPYEGNATSITVTNANGEFTFISCLSDGTPSGNIIELGFANGSLITDFNGLGLSNLTYLNLFGEKLTSFDGVGLTSLTDLNLNSNEELTSITNLPLTLVSLTLVGSPITSIDISGMNSLTSLYLADAYGTNALVTSTNNSSILAQLDSSGVENGTFITSNGRTSAGNVSYDNLINKGWNIMGAEEEISLLFDLTVDNGIPNQLVVLSTLPQDGGKKGGHIGLDGPSLSEYAEVVTDENGIATFSGVTGSTTMWVVQVYNTSVKEGLVVWTSAFEAGNSTTVVNKTRTFFSVDFTNQDDNGVIVGSDVEIHMVNTNSMLAQSNNVYPILMYSGVTDVNGNITTNLSDGSYIIRTFDENGDLTWGQFFDVSGDSGPLSITRPLSENIEVNISDVTTTTYTNMWTVNNGVPVEGMNVYYYDGSKEVFSFDPLSFVGQSTIVNPTLVLLGQTDATGGFSTSGNPVSISSGVIGVIFGNTDNEGKLYDVVSNEYNTIELGTNVNGTKFVEWTAPTPSIQYSEWHPQAPTGKHIRISVVQNANWVAIDSFNSVEGANTYFSSLAGGTEYKLVMYNDLTVSDNNIGYTEYWTPNWNDSKTTIWDGVPN